MNPCTMPGGNANRPQPGVVISTTFLDDVCGINPTPDFRSYEEKQKDPTNGGKQNVKHLRKGPSVVMSLPDCIFRADNMLGLDTDIPDSLMKSLFFDDSLMFINQKASEEQSSPSSPSIITDQIRDCNNRDFKFLNSFLGRWGTEVTMGASQGGIIDTMLTLDGDSNYKDKGEIPDIAMIKQAQKYIETSTNEAHFYEPQGVNGLSDMDSVRKMTFNDGIQLLKDWSREERSKQKLTGDDLMYDGKPLDEYDSDLKDVIKKRKKRLKKEKKQGITQAENSNEVPVTYFPYSDSAKKLRSSLMPSDDKLMEKIKTAAQNLELLKGKNQNRGNSNNFRFQQIETSPLGNLYKLRYLSGENPNNQKNSNYFPLPTKFKSMTSKEILQSLPSFPFTTNNNNNNNNNNMNHMNRRRRLLLVQEEEEEETKETAKTNQDASSTSEASFSSELNPTVLPKNLINGRAYQSDIVEITQTVTGGKRSVPLGVDSPRLADLSHWVRLLRHEPIANFAQSYVSIPTLLLSIDRVAKVCTFGKAQRGKNTRSNLDMPFMTSPSLAENYGKFSYFKKRYQYDYTMYAMHDSGRSFIRKVAVLENYIRWRLFKEEQISILKDRASNAKMLQSSILQSLARSMVTFVKLAHKIDFSADEGKGRLNSKVLAWNRILTLGTASPDAQDFNSLTEAASTAVFTQGPYNRATSNYCGLQRAIEMREAEVSGNFGRRMDRISGLDPTILGKIESTSRSCLKDGKMKYEEFFTSRFLEKDHQERGLKQLHANLWTSSCSVCTELIVYVSNPSSSRRITTTGEFKGRNTKVAAFCDTRATAFLRESCIAIAGDLLHSIIQNSGFDKNSFASSTSSDIAVGADLNDAIQVIHLTRSDGTKATSLNTAEGRLLFSQFICWRQMACFAKTIDDISTFKQSKRTDEEEKNEKIKKERKDMLRELTKNPKEIDVEKVKELSGDVFRDSTNQECRTVLNEKNVYDQQLKGIDENRNLQKCVACQKFVSLIRIEMESENNQETQRDLIIKHEQSQQQDQKDQKNSKNSKKNSENTKNTNDKQKAQDLFLIELNKIQLKHSQLKPSEDQNIVRPLVELTPSEFVSKRKKGKLNQDSSSINAICTKEEYDDKSWNVIDSSGCGKSPFDVDGLREMSSNRDPNFQQFLEIQETIGTKTKNKMKNKINPIQLAMALASKTPGEGGMLGLPSEVDTLIKSIQTKQMLASNLPLQCGGQSITKSTITTIHKYVKCLNEKTRGTTSTKISKKECIDSLLDVDQALNQRLAALTSALGVPYNENDMSILDRIQLYSLARSEVYTGEYVSGEVAEPKAMDIFKYKLAKEGDVESVCMDLSLCKSVEHFTLARAYLHRSASSASRSNSNASPKDIAAYSPGRGGVDIPTTTKELKDTTMSVGKLKNLHQDGATNQKKKSMLLEIKEERKKLRLEQEKKIGTHEDMVETMKNILSFNSNEHSNEHSKQKDTSTAKDRTTKNIAKNTQQETFTSLNEMSFLELNQPNTIENYYTDKILESNDQIYHDPDVSRMLDNRLTSKDSELLSPPSTYLPKDIQKYYEDLLAMSTSHYKSQVEKLKYENLRIQTSIQHSKRIAQQAHENMISIGKPILPGTSSFGTGVDVVTGETRRPLFHMNTAGMVYTQAMGQLASKYIISAALSVEPNSNVDAERYAIYSTLNDIVTKEMTFNGLDLGGNNDGAMSLSQLTNKYQALFSKGGVLVERKIKLQMYSSSLMPSFLKTGEMPQNKGTSKDYYELSNQNQQMGKASLYGEHYEILANVLNSEKEYHTESSPYLPISRKYKSKDDIMKYIVPIGGDSLRRDLCSNEIQDVLQDKLVTKNVYDSLKTQNDDKKDDKENKDEETDNKETKETKENSVGEEVIALYDCLISEYQVISDLDIGEVNMKGIFNGRDLEEQEESLKAGEIIQLCSSKHIQQAQNWLKRYGTHFISGVTMGCEVVQKFRIEKEDVYVNQYMHPNDYIQTILGKYSKKRGGEHDVRIIWQKHM